MSAEITIVTKDGAKFVLAVNTDDETTRKLVVAIREGVMDCYLEPRPTAAFDKEGRYLGIWKR